MTASDDHGTLPRHAELMLRRLEALTGQGDAGGSTSMLHMDHAKRAHQLAHHLRAALVLSDAHYYPSAFVVVRAALEHHLLDRLIFLARRRIVVYLKARKAAGWQDKLVAAQAGDAPDIARWFWDRDGLNVVYRGLHSGRSKKGLSRQTVSAHYFQVADYDPFAGPTKHAGRLAAPFWGRRQARQRADEADKLWRYVFQHRAVMKALRVNGLLLGRHQQVDVHYAFLSGYAHPSKRGYEAIFGGNTRDRMGAFSHMASELVLLYVIVLAAAELDIWSKMARRPPRLMLRDLDEVQIEVLPPGP